MNFNDKKLRKEVEALEHRLQTLENSSKGYSKASFEEIAQDNRYLMGLVRALFDYLDVYPTKEMVADTRYLPVEQPMVEVYRVKSNKKEATPSH